MPRRLLPLLLAGLPLTTLADDLLDRARDLLRQGQAPQAYQLLATEEGERAGDPAYDELLGVAALEAGQPNRAAFALERCIEVDPRHGPCRVHMARTQLALGETAAAKQTLSEVQATQPPPEVQALIGRYLGAVTEREAQEQRELHGHAEIGLGHDSNVNHATSDSQVPIAIPGGNILLLPVGNLVDDDVFGQAQAGLRYRQRLTPAWDLLAAGTIDGRWHQDVDGFDHLSLDGELGAAYRAGLDTWTVKLQGQHYRLDDESLRRLGGFFGQYFHPVGTAAALTLYAQLARLDYTADVRDADRYTLGGAWSQAVGDQTIAYFSAYGGAEKISSAGADQLGYELAGLRLGGQYSVSKQLAFTLGLSAEQRRHDAIDPLAQRKREDQQYDASAGVNWRWAEQWSLRPQLSWTRNDSTLSFFDYDRVVGSLNLRFDY